MYYCYRKGKSPSFLWKCYPRASAKSDAEWMVPPYVHRHASDKNILYAMPQISSYRRLWARPGLRRAAIVPCPFIPLDLGRGVIPFETLQRSRRDPLGP
jgi:hypothetical protein